MLSDRILGLLRNPESPDWALKDALLDEEWPVANVYVVCGSTGEYSDYRGWTVAAFLDKAAAEAFCEQLNQWCKDNGVHDSAVLAPAASRPKECPLDPRFDCSYTGVSYALDEIPLRADGG